MRRLITLERDETGVIVAECPLLRGCISQGETEVAAMENIREAIQGCLVAREANKLEIDNPANLR